MNRNTRKIGWLVPVALLGLAMTGRTEVTYDFVNLGAGFPIEINSVGEVLMQADTNPGPSGTSRWLVRSDHVTAVAVPFLSGGSFLGGVGTGSGLPRLADPLAPGAMGLIYGYGDTGSTYVDSEGNTQLVIHGFVFDPSGAGAMMDVGTLAGTTNSYVFAMDADGWAYAIASEPGIRAFAWHRSDPDTRIEIWPADGSEQIDANAIQQRGGKVLLRTWSPSSADPSPHTYVWDSASGFTTVSNGARALNASGELIGSSETGVATHWSSSGDPTDLSSLLPSVDPNPATLLLKDSGWVAGTYPSADSGEYPFAWNARDGGKYDLRDDVEAAGGFSAAIAGLTEDGQIEGYFFSVTDGGAHVFVWDRDHGLEDLTPDATAPTTVAIEALSPTGKVEFQDDGFFAWQRVGGTSTRTALAGFDVGGGSWNPALFGSASGSILNVSYVEGEYDTILAVPAGETLPGSDVEATFDDGTTIQFGQILAPGETTVTAYGVDDPQPPPLPPNFQLAGTGTLFDISTTATFDGYVTLAIHYEQGTIDEGGSLEMQVRLLHLEGGEWVDRTDHLDMEGNLVYGVTTSLSPFAIVTANYVFGGFAQPVNADGSSIFKIGRVIPLKFSLADDRGSNVAGATAHLKLYKITEEVLGTAEESDVSSAGDANDGDLFRYDSTANQYVFNLATKGLSQGSYRASAVLDDGTIHSVTFSLRTK